MIEELLPLLDGLKEESFRYDNVLLLPGRSIEWKAPSDGWLIFTIGVCNQKHATITHNIWVKETSFSPYLAYTYGFTQESNTHVFCSKYDEVNNFYVLVYAPRPFKFFRKDDYIRITAPTFDPITNTPITEPTVGTLYIETVLIIDYKKFRESFKSIFGGSK